MKNTADFQQVVYYYYCNKSSNPVVQYT